MTPHPNEPADRPPGHRARLPAPRPYAFAMSEDNHTSLAGRIDAIERNLQKLRRETGRLSALTTRNREDLDHALADVDELLYAALATGREIAPGDASPDTTGAGADPPRCTHPAHDAEPPETRPVAAYLMTLRSRHAESGQPHLPLPRCADCAAHVLKGPSASRITVRRIDGGKPASTPRCQSPAHFAADRPRATTVIVTAGVRPGIRYCDACAETTRATLEHHRIPCESAPIVVRSAARTGPSAGRR